MAHYLIDKGKLRNLSEKPFNLEVEIKKTIEDNLSLLFDLELIKSEFQLHDLRIDTLAFDKESKSFVIIEYKQDKRFSVIDQYNARENLDHFLGQIKMEKRYNKALKMEVISYGNA